VVQTSSSTTRHIRWVALAPLHGWVVINSDAAMKSTFKLGGEWISGFAKGLGSCRVMVAELWGAWEGLKSAWEKGYRRVEAEL
ncbi:putative ribonuclease H protein, partial [Trifolium medium]|nr:putative ribonuclease H protein [Trifolium medium]